MLQAGDKEMLEAPFLEKGVGVAIGWHEIELGS
jgi:hypothetical protein